MAGRARRRRRVRLVAALGALVVALAAAALLWPRPSSGALRVPVVERAPTPGGVLRGTLAADRDGDLVCYTMRTAAGTAVLRFPPGWSADERLGLRDASGGVVAQPGSAFTMLGAPAGVGSVPGCTARGRIWTVTSVDLRAR